MYSTVDSGLTITLLPTLLYIRQPGFHLRRHTWSPMNRSGQVKAHVVLSCTNGVSPNQHPEIVASATDHEPYCQHVLIKKFECGLNLLHEADDDAVIWLESTVTAADSAMLSQADWFVVACLGLHAFVLDINAEADDSTSCERGLTHLLTSHHGICFWRSSFWFVRSSQLQV